MLKTPTRPKRCPWCNSNLVAEIIHEINSLTPAILQDLNDRRSVLGARLKDLENPKWQCMDCGTQIYGHRQTCRTFRKPQADRSNANVLPSPGVQLAN
jgi:hypothetical protein